jgi:hypothetical protein
MATVEQIVNGGFEDPLSTGWTLTVPWGYIERSTTNPHSGTYCLRMSTDSWYSIYISQDIDLTNVDLLTLYYKFANYDGGYWKVWIDTTAVATYSSGQSSWTYDEIDVSSYSGTRTLKFEAYGYDYNGVFFQLDDVSALASTDAKATISISASGESKLIPIIGSDTLTLAASAGVKLKPLAEGSIQLAASTAGVSATLPQVGATILLEASTGGVIAPTAYAGLNLLTSASAINISLPLANAAVELLGESSVKLFPIPAESNLYLSPAGALKLIPNSAESAFGLTAVGLIRFDYEAWLSLAAEASIKLIPPSAEVTITVTPAVAPVKIYSYLDQYKWISATVIKSVSDPIGSLNIEIDGITVPPYGSDMDIWVDDHTGFSQQIFSGVIFNPQYNVRQGRTFASVTGYEYGYYLTNQGLADQNYTFPTADYEPADIVNYQLGGDPSTITYWEQVTGIHPYRILNPTDNGHDYTPKEFVFTSAYSKQDAIGEVANYANMVFLVRNSGIVSPDGRPIAFFVHVDDVDDLVYGLALPPMRTFTWPDPYVVDIKRVVNSGESVNRVIVRGIDTSGVLHEYIKEDSRVTSGELRPVELVEESADYATDELAEARANELYSYYRSPSISLEATLIKRVDLQLYQLVKFVDFPGISSDPARIIYIEYQLSHSDPVVKITASYDTDVYKILGRARSQSADPITEIQAVSLDVLKKRIKKANLGDIVSIDEVNGTVTLRREDGGTQTVRFS